MLPAVRIVREAGRRIAAILVNDPDMQEENYSVLEIDAMLCDVMVRANAYPTASVPVVLPTGHKTSDAISHELKAAWTRVSRLQPCDCYQMDPSRPCLSCIEDMKSPLPMHWQRYKRKWVEQLTHFPNTLQKTIPLLRVFEPASDGPSPSFEEDRPHIIEMIKLPDVRDTNNTEVSKCDTVRPCVICMENRPDVLLMNCLHLCVCTQCMNMGSIETCPCCRKEVFKAVKVYM